MHVDVTLFLYQHLLGFDDIVNVGTQYRMEGDLLTSGYGISPSSALSALQGSQVTSMIITVCCCQSHNLTTISAEIIELNILENHHINISAWSFIDVHCPVQSSGQPVKD